MTAVIMLY